MKKPSTTTVRRIGKLQDRQLTIGLDLGDRSSFYCVLNRAGEVILEGKSDQPGSHEEDIRKDAPESICLGNGYTFSVGEPTLTEVGHEVTHYEVLIPHHAPWCREVLDREN